MGNIIFGFAFVADRLVTLYMWVIIFNALISFVEPNPYNRFVILLRRLSEPAQRPFRRWTVKWSYQYRMDLSPLFVILAVYLVRMFVLLPLMEVGRRMGG